MIKITRTTRYYLLALFFAQLVSFVAKAQDNISYQKDLYIEKHTEQLAFKIGLTNQSDFFEISSPAANYKLQPNTDLKLKLFASYRYILFAIAFAPRFLPGNNDEIAKGKSDIFSFATGLNLNHWYQRLAIDKTKGYYSSNQNYLPGDERYLVFPELEYMGFSGQTLYKFNPNYSFVALENQTERQLKSTGSFIPALGYRYYIVDNKIKLNENNSSQKSNNFETNISIGYYYTLVVNRGLYISGGASVGGGVIFAKVLTRQFDDTTTFRDKAPILRTEASASLGYNAKSFFCGTQMTGFLERYNENGTTTVAKHNGFNMQFFVGYRFNAPDILSKSIKRF